MTKTQGPITPEAASAAMSAALAEPAAPPHRTVLLVEDDEVSNAGLLTILKIKGWGVVSARTVKDAIIALSVLPDIVVLDLMLPDGLGLEVFKEIRRRKLAAKVIVTTGVDDNDPRLKAAVELQPYQVISKPISLASLFFSMEHQLRANMLDAPRQSFAVEITRARKLGRVALVFQFVVMAVGFAVILRQVWVNRELGRKVEADVGSRNAQFDEILAADRHNRSLLEHEIALTRDNRQRLDEVLARLNERFGAASRPSLPAGHIRDE